MLSEVINGFSRLLHKIIPPADRSYLCNNN